MMKQNYAVGRFNYISQIKQKSPASQQGFFYAILIGSKSNRFD